jgi:hypothetical protein
MKNYRVAGQIAAKVRPESLRFQALYKVRRDTIVGGLLQTQRYTQDLRLLFYRHCSRLSVFGLRLLGLCFKLNCLHDFSQLPLSLRGFRLCRCLNYCFPQLHACLHFTLAHADSGLCQCLNSCLSPRRTCLHFLLRIDKTRSLQQPYGSYLFSNVVILYSHF